MRSEANCSGHTSPSMSATAAKYVRLLSDYKIDVVLIEPQDAFISCPISNLVLGGSKQMGDITTSYAGLSKNHGIKVVKDYASAVDTAKKTVTLAGGATIAYDKLVVSPGIELMFDSIDGLKQANASGQILQAWKAGAETVALRKQLEAMPDGGVYALTIPEAPYRCPPGPYERASVIAAYFKAAKPRSKVLILDANPDVTSKGPLFKKVWAEQYKGILEYRGQHKATAVDAKAGIIKFDVQDDVKANVLNVLPAMRAGTIAVQTGLNNQAKPDDFYAQVFMQCLKLADSSKQMRKLIFDPRIGEMAAKLEGIDAIPFWTNSGLTSISTTSTPLWAATCAMPAPICPAPTTASVLTSKVPSPPPEEGAGISQLRMRSQMG